MLEKNVKASVDSHALEWQYHYELCKIRNEMQENIEALKKAYKGAQWNDMVSENVRIQLNEYIDSYNRAIGELNSVISAVSEMCKELDKYESIV